MAQVSVITSASEESTSETETENCEETSQAEVTAETETSEVSAALTGPPAIVLTDPLSSAMSSFEVSSGNRCWMYRPIRKWRRHCTGYPARFFRTGIL